MHRISAISALVCVPLVTVASTGCRLDTAASRDAERERILQERAAQDETAIRAASAGWSNAAQSKELERSLYFFADNAILLISEKPSSRRQGEHPQGMAADVGLSRGWG